MNHVEVAKAEHDEAVKELREAQAGLKAAQERLFRAESESARTGVNITWAYQDQAVANANHLKELAF